MILDLHVQEEGPRTVAGRALGIVINVAQVVYEGRDTTAAVAVVAGYLVHSCSPHWSDTAEGVGEEVVAWEDGSDHHRFLLPDLLFRNRMVVVFLGCTRV